MVRFGIIGFGSMGSALATGLAGVDTVIVWDPDSERRNVADSMVNVQVATCNRQLVDNAEAVVLAVKPDKVVEVLGEVADRVTPAHTVVSIAAGVTISSIENVLPAGIPVIRAMPNTPCLVRSGAVAVSRGSAATSQHEDIAVELFGTVGRVIRVPEKMMDAVTGLSGSGPAYVGLIIEALIEAGVNAGLSRSDSVDLVLQTIRGTVEMIEAKGEHPAVLRERVTSPGGTTAAGLRVLENRAVRGAIIDAVAAATQRSSELGTDGQIHG